MDEATKKFFKNDKDFQQLLNILMNFYGPGNIRRGAEIARRLLVCISDEVGKKVGSNLVSVVVSACDERIKLNAASQRNQKENTEERRNCE